MQRADVPVLPSAGIADLAPDGFAAVFTGAAGFAGAAAIVAAGLDAADAVPVPFIQVDMNALYVVAFLSAADLPFQLDAQADIVPPGPDILAGVAIVDAGAAAIDDEAGAAVLAPDLVMQVDIYALRVVAFLSAALIVFQDAEQVAILFCDAVFAALFASAGEIATAAIAATTSIIRMACSL